MLLRDKEIRGRDVRLTKVLLHAIILYLWRGGGRKGRLCVIIVVHRQSSFMLVYHLGCVQRYGMRVGLPREEMRA